MSNSNINDKREPGQSQAGSSSKYPFSAEVPELLQKHLDHLKASAISLEVIKERGYKSVLGKTHLKEAGFSKTQQRAPGILIPLHGVDGALIGYQYRPDHPRQDPNRDRVIKYENPVGSSVRLDVPPRCLMQLGDPGVPLFFTEGVKKGDALASVDVCAIDLTGVWGFKGKNPLGGTTILADFDYITLKDRLVYLVFDSDSASNPQVAMALKRLAEHLKRKGARVHIIRIPSGANGEKIGADDYLAQGHTLDDLESLEVTEAAEATLKEKSHDAYCIDDGRLCWIKQTPNGPVEFALCNFTARVIEDILKDNGYETSRLFKIIGTLGTGQALPIIEVPASGFNSLNWVTAAWGMPAIIAAGQLSKDRVREAIQLQSQDAAQRLVYTHTGWREINGQLTFLSASGALEMPEVDTELKGALQRYCLPEPVEDPGEAIRASLRFLDVGTPEIVAPVWAAMYLAPLSEILIPAFTLWLFGPTGGFKSTLLALALCHFGEFTVRTLPASWVDTGNYLVKQLSLGKDIPLVIDDWIPAPDMGRAKEFEAKAEMVDRAQGNRLGRGRLRSDTSSRVSYIPRGMLLSSGEQLPGGQSHSARLFSIEVEPGDINIDKVTNSQAETSLYSIAMTHYLLWLKEQPELRKRLSKAWGEWRNQAQTHGTHPRLPEAVAWLYSGFDLAMAFIEEKGVISSKEAEERRRQAWAIFLELAARQGGRVEEERPGRRFIEALRTLIDQGKVVFWHKDEEAPRKAVPGEIAIGWKDEGYLLLNPSAAYAAVHQFCQSVGMPLTFKEQAVWKDIRRMGLSVCQEGRTANLVRIYGQPKRVIKLREKALEVN